MYMILTNAGKQQYWLDLLRVCSWPRNTILSVSYRHAWTDPNIIRGDASEIENEPALFWYYYDPRTQSHSKNNLTPKPEAKPDDAHTANKFAFHPVRYCTILKAENMNGQASTTYTLKLGDWFRYHDDSERNANKINNLSNRIYESAKNPPIQSKELNPDPQGNGDRTNMIWMDDASIAPQIKSDQKNNKNQDANWLSFAQHMCSLPQFRSAILWTPATSTSNDTLSSISRGDSFFELLESTGDGFARTDIRSGDQKHIALLIKRGVEQTGRLAPPTIEVDKNLTKVFGPMPKQRSASTEVLYHLAFNDVLSKNRTHINIKSIPSHADNSEFSVLSADLNTIVRINPSKFSFWAAIILFTLGTFISGFDVDLLGFEDTQKDIERNVSIFLTVTV